MMALLKLVTIMLSGDYITLSYFISLSLTSGMNKYFKDFNLIYFFKLRCNWITVYVVY